MMLESLHELVELLRRRIDQHRAALSGNEMLTRYALIDPLLRELGWDTSDPMKVTPEDTSGLGRGRPDYVLLTNGQPVMVVEAKKLGSGLQAGASQAIQYAMDPNRQARYFATTDGQHWEVFDTERPASDMSVILFDLIAVSSAEVCLQALALWRPGVAAGSVSAAQAPIIEPQPQEQQAEAEPLEPAQSYSPASAAQPEAPRISEPQSASEFLRTTTYQRERANTPQAVSMHEITGGTGDGEWIPLSDLSVIGRSPPPTEIQFPDNSLSQIRRWNTIVTESVRWLQASGYLNSSNWRVRRNSRYVVSDSPKHPNGKEFIAQQSADHLFVEGNYSAKDLVKNAIIIIERTGQDPAQFKVRFDTPSASSHTSAPVFSASGIRNYDNADWIPMSDLNIRRGRNGRNPSPLDVQFPDNRIVRAGRWTHVMRETIRWLIDNHYLDRSHCPIRHASRYIIADRPVHPTGTEFTYMTRIEGFYIEMNTSPPQACIRNSLIVIERAGQDPAQFKVRLR
ncbi:MAG: hypothetical protein F4Y44_04310 [Chloroflexi bacterium]|nr:hypothetical protein [Chloroflexota bacterium]